MVPVLWLVVSVVFLLIHLVSGDPVTQMLGEDAASANMRRHCNQLLWNAKITRRQRAPPV